VIALGKPTQSYVTQITVLAVLTTVLFVVVALFQKRYRVETARLVTGITALLVGIS
jgi:Na+-translocating ferredoxin:NAD+ oxidoreductase RNF subunit RnfB